MPKRKRGDEVLLKLEEKANLSPAASDALDFKRYNAAHLRHGSAKSVASFERRRDHAFRAIYVDGKVEAAEGYEEGSTLNDKVVRVLEKAIDDDDDDDNNDYVHLGYSVQDGAQGSRTSDLAFSLDGGRERGRGCNSYDDEWPVGVVTLGRCRTLPELLEDAMHYFRHPYSGVKFYLGIKLYVPTKQMIAFLRQKDDVSWAVSFGLVKPESSTIAVLEGHNVRVSGVVMGDEPCSRPGIPAYVRKLDCKVFQVEIDFYLIQQACLSALDQIAEEKMERQRQACNPDPDCPRCTLMHVPNLMPVCERQLTQLPRATHYGNEVEQQITMQYLHDKKLSIQDVVKQNGASTDDPASVSESTLTPICDFCADQIVATAMDKYRLSIPKSDISDKPDCRYGFNCRTQHSNPDHARRLNHMCVGK